MRLPNAFALMCALSVGVSAAAENPNYRLLGKPGLKPEALTVFPDGTGLPRGSGTVPKGKRIYDVHCSGCHGRDGKGIGVAEFPALAGGDGTLGTSTPIQTVGSYWPLATTLFDYIRRAMPYATPGVLTDSEVFSVSGYVLHLNGLLPADAEVTAQTLVALKMPNRNGFLPAVVDPREVRPWPTRDMAR